MYGGAVKSTEEVAVHWCASVTVTMYEPGQSCEAFELLAPDSVKPLLQVKLKGAVPVATASANPLHMYEQEIALLTDAATVADSVITSDALPDTVQPLASVTVTV